MAFEIQENDNLNSENKELKRTSHELPSIKSTVVIRQVPSQGISFKLWPPAFTLLNLLSATTTLLRLPSRRPLRILELGSGTGLVGISAAALLSAAVTVTDLPNVLENLRFNVEANAGVVEKHGGSVHVASLEWGKKDDVEGEFDVVVGSDLVYHEHLFEPLLKTLGYLFRGKEDLVFVLAHFRRWKKDSCFFKKARKMFYVEVVHVDDDGNGELRSEGARGRRVVVYRFVAKQATR